MDAAAQSSPPVARTAPYDGIDGLAWGYRFSKTGVAEPLQGPALREALEKQEVWLWLNFDLADERASATIAALPHLPPGALAMLRSADDRQQIDGFGQAIAGVAADYERCDPPDEKRVVRWNFAMTPYVFVSARRRPGHALNQVRSDLQSGRRLPDVLGLFHALIHELASAISLVLNELGAKLNEMEERLLDQKEVGSDVLGQARRRLVRVRRQALPLRAVLIHMVNEHPYWFDDDAVADCQRVAARMDGLVDDMESPSGTRPRVTGRTQGARGGKNQQEVDGAVDRIGAAAAADVHHRYLRHERDRAALSGNRVRSMGGVRADSRVDGRNAGRPETVPTDLASAAVRLGGYLAASVCRLDAKR